MRPIAQFPLKKIQATDPQVLINLKLRYNTLVDKINENNFGNSDRDKLLEQINRLHSQINFFTPSDRGIAMQGPPD